MPTQEEIEQALTDIGKNPSVRGQCWTLDLKDQALDFLYILERMERDGERVTRSTAAEKFYDLFGFEVSQGQLSHHLTQRCHCKRKREY